MRKIIKLTVAFTMLLICANIVSAQNRVGFNDYGIYLVQNGITKKIHPKKDLAGYDPVIKGVYFWENYLVLSGYSPICYIYNIETGAMSDYIGDFSPIKLERGNNLIAYIALGMGDYWIYEYEPDTLELISKVKLKGNPFPDLQRSSYLDDFYEKKYWQYTEEEKMNDRLYRYRGANFYLDVHYGPAIDLSGKYFGPFVDGGKKNVFIVIIEAVLYYSH